MKITVKDIVDLIRVSCHAFRVRIFTSNTTFCFKDDEIPEEVLFMQVKSISPPEHNGKLPISVSPPPKSLKNTELEGLIPLYLNIYYYEFEDFKSFKEIYKDYIVD